MSVRTTASLEESAPLPLDRPTFEAVYEEHFEFVWRTVRRLGVPMAAADDVTQEVFVVAHRRLSDWQPTGSLRGWLFGIARRVASDQRRIAEKHRRPVDLDFQPVAMLKDPMPPDVDVFLARTRAAYNPDSGAKIRVRAAVIAATSASSGALVTKAAAAKLSGTKVSGTAVTLLIGGAISSVVLIGAFASSERSDVGHLRNGSLDRVTRVAVEEQPRLSVGMPALAIPMTELVGEPELMAVPDVHRGVVASAPTAEPKARELTEELRLIRRAAQALREGQPAEARQALSEHRQRFPRGKLSVERWGLDVLSQCSGGASTGAREAAERFLESAPSSPLASHVREDCLK